MRPDQRASDSLPGNEKQRGLDCSWRWLVPGAGPELASCCQWGGYSVTVGGLPHMQKGLGIKEEVSMRQKRVGAEWEQQ